MPIFSYKARTAEGQMVDGSVTADNEMAALRALDERALFPVEVSEGGAAGRSAISGKRKKVRQRQLAEMYGQLGDLLRAGVPVLRSLDVLCRQNASPVLTEVLREVRQDVAGGEALADSMAKHPNAFRELDVAMIRAGERGAFLEDVLQRIAAFTERQNELRNKLVGSMIYPCVLVTVATLVVVMLLAFVVPRVRPSLESAGGDLPALTRGVFAAGDFLRSYLWAVVLAGGGAVAGLAAYVRSPRGRDKLDRFKLRAPGIGRIYNMTAICRFCRILGTLLANGVPVLQSLRISQGSMGNKILEDAIEEASENVRQGDPLAEPLRASGCFPLDIIDMVAVGEEANNLENVLIHIADSNEARTARAIDLAVRVLEPVLLVIMAGVVLFIALALLVPILTSSTFRGGG
jgi:general secretion pathway protein F/type IV pilus assembly protein PilC